MVCVVRPARIVTANPRGGDEDGAPADAWTEQWCDPAELDEHNGIDNQACLQRLPPRNRRDGPRLPVGSSASTSEVPTATAATVTISVGEVPCKKPPATTGAHVRTDRGHHRATVTRV